MNTKFVKPSIHAFFGLTFLFSWSIWIPLSISHLENHPFISEGSSNIIRLVGVLGPAIIAILVFALTGGRKAVAGLLGRLKIWQVGWEWWVTASIVQPVLLLVIALAYNGLGGNPGFKFGSSWNTFEFVVQVVLLSIATLGEEIGWRGLALPALLKTHGAFQSSLILGVIWSVWHIPFWLLQDSFDQYGGVYMLLNCLMIVPMSVYITWVFNHTRGSILLAAVFHLTFNIVNVTIIPLTALIAPYVAFILIQWLIALWLIWRYKPQALARDMEVAQVK
jgi:uncharacterized protein